MALKAMALCSLFILTKIQNKINISRSFIYSFGKQLNKTFDNIQLIGDYRKINTSSR